MKYDSRSSVAERPRPIEVHEIHVSQAPSWKNFFTISTAATATLAAALLLVSPEVGLIAAAGGVVVGAVSAGIALTRPDSVVRSRRT